MRQPAPQPDDDHGHDYDAFTELGQALDRADERYIADHEHPAPPAPVARTALLTLLFAAAVLLLAGVIGYTSSKVAVTRAERHTDARVEVLEKDLQQRREAAAEANANRDAQISELRRLVCVFADHATPRDRDVQQVRARYSCDTPFPPLPSVSPAPAPSRS